MSNPGYLKVRNWDTFQQYRDRDPKWIKLHRELLDDYEIDSLSEKNQLHLIKIWLLAAKLNNKIPNDPQWIARKINAKSKVDLKQFVTDGFLCPYTDVHGCTDMYLEEEEEEEEETYKAEKKKTMSDDTPDPVVTVFDHWAKVCKHPQAMLSVKRRALINKAFKIGYTPEQLCEAMTGCALTPFNQGDNDRGQRYDGIELILRSEGQIERFIANAANPPKPNGKESKREKYDRQLEQWSNQRQADIEAATRKSQGSDTPTVRQIR